MDWKYVFEEMYPQPGATNTVIAEFEAEVKRPISLNEVQAINESQQNPFPKNDPLYASWRAFDASAWVIPEHSLPDTYLSFLKWSDGGEFRTGERWFQFFPALDPTHGVRAMLLAYHLPQYMPGAIPIAFNGGGTFYLLDMRQPAIEGEFPVVCVDAGYLTWKPEACRTVASTFMEACRGKVSIDDL